MGCKEGVKGIIKSAWIGKNEHCRINTPGASRTTGVKF